MKILVVSDVYPWPPRTGYRQRVAAIVRALAGQGEVDLFAVVSEPGAATTAVPADVALRRNAVTGFGPPPASGLERSLHWLRGAEPRELLRRDWTHARTALSRWAEPGYDLVWFSHAGPFLALHQLVPPPHVVDLDNLQAAVLDHRRAARRRAGSAGSARRWTGFVADWVDERRWRRLESGIARAASAVVVCSELDRGRLGAPAAVVANGYDPPEALPAVSQRWHRDSRDVLIMVGLLTYAPNRDAARHFVHRILPSVRARRPGATFRLVGRHDAAPEVSSLSDVAGVVVTGEVNDVARELADADIAVVPIRFGGGTRIKILEAFAHRVPVVSTSIGCEGLDVVDGEHLLIADDDDGFARACVRLLEDADLRARLTASAAQLWERLYRWERITPAITDVVRSVAR